MFASDHLRTRDDGREAKRTAVKSREFAADGPRDRGGSAGKPANGPHASFGVRMGTGSETTLQYVFSDGAAARAGLAAGDVVVAVDGLRCAANGLDAVAERSAPGERVTVHVFRRDEPSRWTSRSKLRHSTRRT